MPTWGETNNDLIQKLIKQSSDLPSLRLILMYDPSDHFLMSTHGHYTSVQIIMYCVTHKGEIINIVLVMTKTISTIYHSTIANQII